MVKSTSTQRLGDLPVFNYTDKPVLISKAQIRSAPRLATDSFIRYIWLGHHAEFTHRCLRSLLLDVDSSFDRTAKAAGSRVVRHSWGLLPLDTRTDMRLPQSMRPPHQLLPDGHVLAADVDVIRTAPTPLDEGRIVQLRQGMEAARKDQTTRLQWKDDGEHQFMHGVSPDGQESLWLVDLDPVFYERLETHIPDTIAT